MDKKLFTGEEILELEALEIRGGADASICGQTECSNNKEGCGGGVDQTKCINNTNLCGVLVVNRDCLAQDASCSNPGN